MAEGNSAYARAHVQSGELRQTGIGALGDIAWGTHLCQFYEDTQDLIEILVPYIKAGLENNEFCMWVASEPLRSAQAKAALAARLDNLEKYIANGQLEVLEYNEWYTLGEGFQADRVLQGWVDRLEGAARRGFDGLRLTGNASWLEKPDWHGFSEYEATVDAIFGQHRMIGICTYMLSKCSALEIMDVISNHSSALVKRAGKWQVIQSSERKKVEANLYETEERVRMAVASTGLGTWDFDVASGRMIWSDLCKRHFGLPPDREVDFKTFLSGIHPDDRERVNKIMQEVFRPGSDGCFDAEYRTIGIEDGKERWITSMGRAFLDREGRTVCFLGTTLDITERRRAEAKLRESEARFRTVADTAPVMIWMSGLDKLGTFFNQSWLEFTGRTMEQELGTGWAEGVHPEDLDRCLAVYSSSFEARRRFQMEYRLRRADGEHRLVLDNGIPLYRAGEFAGFIGSCVDITELKAIEDRLRASEARLMSAQRLANLGSWERDETTGNTQFSDEMLRILGMPDHPPRTLVEFLNYVHPEDREHVRDGALQARSTGASVAGEYRVVRADGEVRIVRSVVEAIRNDVGAVIRVVGATQDITDLKRAQEESFARQKLESLGTLASGIAHDFNNILGAMMAQAELGTAELAAGSHPDEALKQIREVAIRGSEIVRQLMIYAGKEGDVLELTDVSKAVEGMLGLLKVTVSQHAALVTDLDQNLPAVKARPAQLRQIVMNLVVNASDAIKDQEGIVRVTTRRVTVDADTLIGTSDCLAAGEYVELEVSDTGIGMSPETQARVFDPFFTTKSAGRGLGLAVVHGIVKSLNGAIRVFSELNHGTAFHILLPVIGAGDRATADTVAGIDEAAGAPREATVLLVEDEDPLRLAVTKMLGKVGFRVLEVDNGSAAIELLCANPGEIDLILLDITIPGATSHEVLAKALQVRPNIKIILTSAHSEEITRSALNGTQIGDFVRKPFQFGDLVRTLRGVLS